MDEVHLPELDDLIVQVIAESDHPEITAVEVVPTADRPDNHTRLRIDMASGASVYVMVGEVRRGGRAGRPYEVPREVLA